MSLSPGLRVGDTGAEKEPFEPIRNLSSCPTMETGKVVPRQPRRVQPVPMACLQSGYRVQTGTSVLACRGHHALADCTQSAWTLVPILCSQVECSTRQPSRQRLRRGNPSRHHARGRIWLQWTDNISILPQSPLRAGRQKTQSIGGSTCIGLWND